MSIYLPSGSRPHLARQFRRHLVLVTALLLLRMGVNIYTMGNISTINTDALVIHDAENQLLSSMVNQETGLRGYLVTIDPLFLQPLVHVLFTPRTLLRGVMWCHGNDLSASTFSLAFQELSEHPPGC